MIVAQLGSSSRTAWMLLAAYVVTALTFGLLWGLQHDGVAAIFCVAAAAGATYMILVLLRRSRLEAGAADVARGRDSAVTADGQLFTSFARYMVGARIRPGVVLIGPTGAAFIPIRRWTNLALEMIVVVFAARFRYVDLALHVPAGGDMGLALEDAAQRYGGFLIDATWTYTASQRWLSRPDVKGLVSLDSDPPEPYTLRWTLAAPPSAAAVRAACHRIAGGGGLIMAVLTLAGTVAWRATGDTQYLIAGVGYAAILGVAIVAGFILINRRMASTSEP